jgi:hypothetical protein
MDGTSSSDIPPSLVEQEDFGVERQENAHLELALLSVASSLAGDPTWRRGAPSRMPRAVLEAGRRGSSATR